MEAVLKGGLPHVHDTAVDIAKLLKTEQARAMGGVIEGKGLDGDQLRAASL